MDLFLVKPTGGATQQLPQSLLGAVDQAAHGSGAASKALGRLGERLPLQLMQANHFSLIRPELLNRIANRGHRLVLCRLSPWRGTRIGQLRRAARACSDIGPRFSTTCG